MNSATAVFKDLLKSFCNQVREFPWENSEAYAYWVGQTYYYVNHSTRLLSLAASKFNHDQDLLHRRFLEHLKEETGHEHLCTADLRNLSYRLEQIPELAQTSAFYQSQYFWIQQIAPISFMGYILSLEGLAADLGPEIYERVKSVHGAKAGNFLRVHSEEDQDHIEKAIDEISKIDEDAARLVIKNYKLSCDLYCNMLDEIKSRVNQNEKKQAA